MKLTISLLMLLFAGGFQAARAQRQVAITIDDIPWTSGAENAAARSAATAAMIATLRAHRAPAAVFVICRRVHASEPNLAQWIVAGATIGNHTTSHRDYHTAPASAWRAEVRSCDAKLRDISGKPVRYFRFPMLHEGASAEQSSAARALLRELHYQNAHVTVDNSDILAANAYSRFRARGDSIAAQRAQAAALAHDLDATRHFEQVAQAKAQRPIPQVILLHANALTAAMLPALLDSLAARGYRFISVDEAYADPIYRLPTCYTGSSGVSFLYRIAPCRAKEDAWDLAAQKRLADAIR